MKKFLISTALFFLFFLIFKETNIQVLANTGSPSGSMSATYNTTTGILSASGTYNNAPDNIVGYALFINGATPVSPGSGSLDGINTNTMHTTTTNPSGSWSDSHTLVSAPSSVCVVIYDVHEKNTSGKHSDIPAGSNRNDDNSYEENDNSYNFMVINGKLDLNKDGKADGNDNGTLLGKTIDKGKVDINGDGSADNSDNGTYNGFQVIKGEIDLDSDGDTKKDNGVFASDPGACVSPTITSDPEATATPTSSPVSTSPSCSGDQHLDASAKNCVSFGVPGAPTPPPANNSTVLGISTINNGKVLGASTMAKTGVVEDSIFNSIFTLGSLLTSFGIMKNGKKKA